MTPQSLMKRRVNTSFLMMLLTLAVQSVVSIPIVVFTVLSMLGIEVSSYYTEFVLVQLLYPLGTCVLALFVLRLISIPRSSVVTIKPLRWDFIPWLGLFLGVTVVMNYTVTFLMELLERIGISIPDAFSSYDPQTLPQAICYFVVLAILPPVCEEILCRASVAGVLKHLHPWTAVLLSSYAFAMMHATVQQIPFAFVLGVVLGFVYVKTGNLLYPILLHFANNAVACLMTYLSVWGEEWVTNAVGYGADLVPPVRRCLCNLVDCEKTVYLKRNPPFAFRRRFCKGCCQGSLLLDFQWSVRGFDPLEFCTASPSGIPRNPAVSPVSEDCYDCIYIPKQPHIRRLL